MKSIRIPALLALTSLFNFNTAAKDLIALENFPDWFQEAMVREKAVTTTSKLEIEKLNASGEIKGKLKLIETDETYWYYTIDIGTDSPVECYAFTSYDGPANSLYGVAGHSLTGAEALNNKELSGRYTYAIDSGVIDGNPYMLLDTLYNLGDGEQKVAGLMKGLSAKTDNSLQICIHNELGYRQTFLSVFASFLNAFSTNQANPEFFSTVYQFSLNGIPVGYASEKYRTDEDGDVQLKGHTAMLVPVDQSGVSRSDTAGVEWSTPAGELINATAYNVENSQLGFDFSISREEGAWQIAGQLQGKEVKSTLEHTGELLTNFGSYIVSASLSDSEVSSRELVMWSPDADPTAATQVRISKIDGNANANRKLEVGPISIDFMSDVNGIFLNGVMHHGPISMNMELMHKVGMPKLP